MITKMMINVIIIKQIQDNGTPPIFKFPTLVKTLPFRQFCRFLNSVKFFTYSRPRASGYLREAYTIRYRIELVKSTFPCAAGSAFFF